MRLTVLLSVSLLICTSCNSLKVAADAESWNGTFTTKNDGIQTISVFFSFKESNGVFNMPDLIPIPLNLFELKRWDDSISFKVGFRSGTDVLLGKYVHADTIKGVSIRPSKERHPFMLYRSTVSNSIFNLPKPDSSDPWSISMKSNTTTEQASKARLEKIIGRYDLDKYIYTKTVMVEDSTIPHSHPVLTINTADTTDEYLISTFVHEQMHWFILSKNENTKRVVDVLKKEFPNAPINLPDGSGDVQSTYEHLIICYYEYQALKELTGKEKADQVINSLKDRLYKWIYKTMLEHEEKISDILTDNGLILQ
jgi:hypothetical protein